MKDKTVMINGRPYDAATGLPVKKPSMVNKPAERAAKPIQATKNAVTINRATPTQSVAASASPHHTIKAPAKPVAAATIHSPAQRSQTLNRRVVKKTAPAVRTRAGVTPAPTASMDIARSSSVSRFAPHGGTPAKSLHAVTQTTRPDHPPVSHPMAQRAVQRTSAPASVTKSKTSAGIKKDAIDMALSAPSPSKKLVKKPGVARRHRKFITTIIVIVIIVALGGVVVYMNMPALSVAIAGSQAGVSASYPSYVPDGYSLKQPISYQQGQVTLNFVGNGNGKGFTINEQQSSWDSSALLSNVVEKAAGQNYLTTQDDGLTIYSYNSDAAWVNDGVMYTIQNAAPLSNQQLQDIATSL